MNTQQISSIVRQVLGVLVSVYGVLSASVASLHLPVAVSTVLVAMGPAILTLEHYLGDPSTGTPTYLQSPPVARPGPQPVPAKVVQTPPQ